MVRKQERHLVEFVITTQSAQETRQLAATLAQLLRAGDFIALVGPLGAGKTCFVQGLAEGMGVEGRVTSPSFVLMRVHKGAVPLCHADAYRLDSAEELLDLGLDDWLDGTVVALEWADRVPEALPDERIEIGISFARQARAPVAARRRLRVLGLGARPARIVEQLKNMVAQAPPPVRNSRNPTGEGACRSTAYPRANENPGD